MKENEKVLHEDLFNTFAISALNNAINQPNALVTIYIITMMANLNFYKYINCKPNQILLQTLV